MTTPAPVPPAIEALRRGVILAELGGHGDGPYCARHGRDAAAVMMGTYIVDPGDDVPYAPSFVFKPGRANYADYLQRHVAAARAGNIRVAVSGVSIDPADTIGFLVTAQEAGADFASFCAHSTMAMFLRTRTSSALCRRANWPALRRWTDALVAALKIPLIFKLGLGDTDDTLGAMDIITDCGVPAIHVNVGDVAPDAPGLDAIAALKARCGFLIVSGAITDESAARRALAAGADAVSIGSAAMKDPDLCGRLNRALHTSPPRRA